MSSSINSLNFSAAPPIMYSISLYISYISLQVFFTALAFILPSILSSTDNSSISAKVYIVGKSYCVLSFLYIPPIPFYVHTLYDMTIIASKKLKETFGFFCVRLVSHLSPIVYWVTLFLAIYIYIYYN